MPDDELLRIIALDQDDLSVLSAHVQDAVLRVKDIRWLAGKDFILVMNRFVWEEAAVPAWRRREYVRRRSVLHFTCVESVQSAGIDRARGDDVLSLLAVRFEATDSPSGEVVLTFSGDATIRLAVEALEARLTDLGPAWSTPVAPRHLLA